MTVSRSRKTRVMKSSSPKFEERYTRVRSIGKGSFGEVWASLDTCAGFREVAIKSVDMTSDATRASVDRELEVLSAVRHANVIELLESSVGVSTAHIVLERGEMSLHAYLHRHGVFHPKNAVPIVASIAAGLSALHAQGYVHTDLKMENVVMIGFTPKIIDFGCARQVESFTTEYKSSPGETPYLTTRWYRAPEMILGILGSMNQAMDVWALGCIAYTLVTGRVLFPGMNEEDMLGWFDLILGPLPATMDADAVNGLSALLDEDFVLPTSDACEPDDTYTPAAWCEDVIASMAAVAKNTVAMTRLHCRGSRRQLFSRISPRARVDLSDLVRDVRYSQMILRMLEYEPAMRVSAADVRYS